MTEKFYKFGVHAEVREDGELFLNAVASTLSYSAGLEFATWISETYRDLYLASGGSAVERVRVAELLPDVEVPLTAADLASNDELNNLDYNEGRETALETYGLNDEFADTIKALAMLVPKVGFDDVPVEPKASETSEVAPQSTPDPKPAVVKRRPGRPRKNPIQ